MIQGHVDVAEWLRWRPAKPLGFARVSSNLIVDDPFIFSPRIIKKVCHTMMYLLRTCCACTLIYTSCTKLWRYNHVYWYYVKPDVYTTPSTVINIKTVSGVRGTEDAGINRRVENRTAGKLEEEEEEEEE